MPFRPDGGWSAEPFPLLTPRCSHSQSRADPAQRDEGSAAKGTLGGVPALERSGGGFDWCLWIALAPGGEATGEGRSFETD